MVSEVIIRVIDSRTQQRVPGVRTTLQRIERGGLTHPRVSDEEGIIHAGGITRLTQFELRIEDNRYVPRLIRIRPADRDRDLKYTVNVTPLNGRPVTAFWMEADSHIIGRQPYINICLPGSHDAAMYRMIDAQRGGTDGNTLTQDRDIYEQLLDGARYFDLRPTLYKGRLHSAHLNEKHRIPALDGYRHPGGGRTNAYWHIRTGQKVSR